MLSNNEQYEHYIHALQNIGTFLRDCDPDEIGYRIFEEFDGDCISFLHVNTLTAMLNSGSITKEIFEASFVLAEKFRNMEHTQQWNAMSVKTDDEWSEILILADELKAMLNHQGTGEQTVTKDSFLKIIQSTCEYPKEYEPPFPYWYPLCRIKDGIPAAVFDLERIYKDRRIRKLKSVLKAMSIGEVISMQNQNDKPTAEQRNLLELLTEKDEDGYNFPWCVEKYYYDESKEWLIYVSHEGTVTFAGEKLARTAIETIPGKYHRCHTGVGESRRVASPHSRRIGGTVMKYYRISKYDPVYRIDGVYRKEEWTSVCDIGKVYGGKVFTEEEYRKVESSYVEFLLAICDLQGITELTVTALENPYHLSWENGQKLDHEGSTAFIRACLREECWARLIAAGFSFEAGYDYYIHVGCPLPFGTVKKLAERYGLFAEDWVPFE